VNDVADEVIFPRPEAKHPATVPEVLPRGCVNVSFLIERGDEVVAVLLAPVGKIVVTGQV
jgi:hypothetical protein